jgi:hypothetical protein
MAINKKPEKTVEKKLTPGGSNFAAPADAGKTSPARATPIPKSEPKKEIPHELIAKRAYEIFVSGKGGSQIDNWLRAERELKGGK